jgi:tubulin-folding cofactor B
MQDSDQFIDGTRVGLENKRGTVRFVGRLNEVDRGKELWLGIDWDKPENGKHDGKLKEKQYFKTR